MRHQRLQRVVHAGAAGEVERLVDAHDQQMRPGLDHVAMDVAEVLGVRDPADDRDVGSAGAVQEHGQRAGHPHTHCS